MLLLLLCVQCLLVDGFELRVERFVDKMKWMLQMQMDVLIPTARRRLQQYNVHLKITKFPATSRRAVEKVQDL